MKRKLILGLCLVLVLCSLSVSTVFAAPSVTVSKSKQTTEFGTLTGVLYGGVGSYWPGGKMYEFSYDTTVTKINNGYVKATIDILNNSTGVKLKTASERGMRGERRISLCYYELDGIPNWTSIDTFAVYGCHEAYQTGAQVIYTKNTYRYADDAKPF